MGEKCFIMFCFSIQNQKFPSPSFLLPAHSPSSKTWLKGQHHHFLISEVCLEPGVWG